MLARINGGNSGIREYLENGLKQGREYGRDDLDNRIVLDGNIDHLENTINSIEDKGQERYIHITLSFAEDEVSNETLKAVTDEYKNLLMNAYHTDEYCFYAEAHLPKIKNMTDERTGELIERKPHIHIVIPEKNLVSGKHMNPRGKGESNIKFLDSIQEHINNKYNLVSPKDSVRVSDNNHANVLSRYKGDFFKGRESVIKKEIFNDLDTKGIKTEKDFLDNLALYGEVKTYNKGKENQYHAVKLPNNDKFTRLKSPLFSEQYVTKRELPLIKPTPKEIEKNLTQWLDKTSHEIKHVYPSSQKNRDVYKALPEDQKGQVLKQIKDKYNERYNLTDHRNQERERALSARGLIERGFKVSREQPNAGLKAERLPSMQERHMVYELQGFRGQQTKQSNAVLSAFESRNLAEIRQTGQYDSRSMRWSQDNRRGINSNLKQQENDIVHKPDYNDLQVMKEIRTKINPDRFISFCADKYKINPNNHAITFAKDGSPRFNVGKTNLNASDFLTKHLKIDWQEAKQNLIDIYNGQLNNTKFNQNALSTKADERSVNRTNNLIKKMHYQESKQINREYSRDLFKISRIKDTDKREIERGFAMFNYLKASERLNTITAAKQIVANEIRATRQIEVKDMAEIYNSDRDLSFSKSMEKKKVLQQYQSDIDKGVKLTDLICSKKEKEITYTDKKSQKEVFTDKGSHLYVPDTSGKEKLALALEYAEKKFGGKLQLSGSEQFKMTAAITAAEKGMNIILTPDKYHQVMLDHAEKMKQDTAAKPEQSTIRQSEELTKNVEPVKEVLGQENSPHLEKIRETIFLRDALANDFVYRNSIMNEQQTQKLEAATDNYLMGDRDLNKFDTAKAEIHAEIIKERTGVDISIDDLKQDIKNSSGQVQDANAQQEAVKANVEATSNPATQSQLTDAVEQRTEPDPTAEAQKPKSTSDELKKIKSALDDLQSKISKEIFKFQQGKIDRDDLYIKTTELVHSFNKIAENDLSKNFEPEKEKVSDLLYAAKHFAVNTSKPEQELKIETLPEARTEHSPSTGQPNPMTVDGKNFDKLIVVPVQKDDGYEKSVSFNMAFKQDDKIVSELKNVKESDLQRMGIDTKGIDMRSIQPVNIQAHSLTSSKIETPLKHAENKLNDFKNSIKNKELSHDDFKAMKAERAKLEDNVAQAKKHVEPEKPQQTNSAKKEQNKGISH